MKRKVLVVDDNLDSVVILRTILEEDGFAVEVAHSGQEALALLDKDPPDVILLDVMMPEMSGFEVLERIKTEYATAKIPVIMVTAKVKDDDLMAGYQHGADYYITKPCTAKQVRYGIKVVLGEVDTTGTSR